MNTVPTLDPKELLAARRSSQDYFSGKISDLSRNIGYGLAAISFGLLSSDSSFAVSVAKTVPWLLILVAISACVTVSLDYLQMVSGWSTASLSAKNETGGYHKTAGAKFWDGCQLFCFYAKQVSAVLGAILILCVAISQVGL